MFFNQKWKLKICFVCNYLWSTNNLFVSSLRFRINIAEQHKTITRIVFYVKWKQSRTIHCIVTEETEIKCFSTNLKTDHWPHWPSCLFVTLLYITSSNLILNAFKRFILTIRFINNFYVIASLHCPPYKQKQFIIEL